MRRREASIGDPWSPLAYVVRTQMALRGTVGLPECDWTTGRSKYAVSLVESLGELRLVECKRDSETETFWLETLRVLSFVLAVKSVFGNDKASVI